MFGLVPGFKTIQAFFFLVTLKNEDRNQGNETTRLFDRKYKEFQGILHLRTFDIAQESFKLTVLTCCLCS